MRSTKSRRDLGQAGIALIIVIAWALTAVIMLTRTLVSAQQIDKRVDSITNSLHTTNANTAFVAQLNKTEKTANAILVAAKPLSDMLLEVDATAKNIDASVGRIDPNAQSIDSTVKSINGNVANILTTARSINSTLQTISGQAVTINGIVVTIKADTAGIEVQTNRTNGIRNHTCRIPLSGCTDP
jgi:hypothetical protein